MSSKYLEVLTPKNSQIIFIDQQPQMAFGVQSIDRQVLKNNVVGARQGGQGLQHPDHHHHGRDRKLLRPHLSRTAGRVPGQRDPRAHLDELLGRPERARCAGQEANGRKKVVVSGLWTEVCNIDLRAVLHALEGGYEIYMVADASGGTSVEAHKYAMDRMVQAGVVPVTWQQVLLEWQRDWARKETYDAVMALVKEHSGAYGMGVDYAYTMVHKAPERVKHGKRIGPNPAK